MRRLLAIIPLVFLTFAVWNFLDDLNARKPLDEAVSRFAVDVRRPIETEMIGYAPSADFAAQFFATSALGDALGRTRLTGLSAAERRAWLDVPITLDEELATGIELQLAALRRNPGWALHRYYLGRLAYTRERRSLGTPVEPDRWFIPLESAWRSAPGNELATEALAGVVIEGWRVLSDEQRAVGPEVLPSAMISPSFVARMFGVTVETLGFEAASGALSDEPAPLSAAVRSLGARGRIAEAALLYERWESSEWRARSQDLERMRYERDSGDLRGLQAAAGEWASRHDVHSFDSDEAHRQLEEVLRLWPRDRVGTWGNDPRSEMLRFFVNGRLDSVDASVLEETVHVISNTPAPVKARIALASGNPGKAESILRNAGSEGSFEWTDYFVDLASGAIKRNDLDAAIEAIARISPAARAECDVVVVRRMAGEEIPPPDIATTDSDGAIVNEAWSANGMLGLCVDPLVGGTRSLVVELEAESPTLVEWGLNTGRRGTLLVDGSERIELSLDGLIGRNVLYTKTLWGEQEIARSARVEQTSSVR